MKKIILILFFPFLVFAQYTKDDSALVRTTFNKSFNKNIIDKYLSSDKDEKIIASLLTISQSDDTSFVHSVIKLNPSKYGNYIAFALGQLGPSIESNKYLLSMISFNQIPKFQSNFFEAIGKTGNEKILETLKENYFNSLWKNYDGISLAIANFYLRGFIKNDEKINDILLNEFSDKNNSNERIFNALYAMYRIGGSEKSKYSLVRILKDYCFNHHLPNEYNDQIIIYSLSNLRRIKYFPNDAGLFRNLINNKNWLIRNESAKTLVNFDFKSENQVDEYFKLINDENPNTSRQAATSLSEIKLSSELNEFLKSKIIEELKKSELSENARGELFISYLKLFPQHYNKFITDYRNTINANFLYRSYGLFNTDVNYLDSLTTHYPIENLTNKITILESLLSFQDTKSSNSNLNNVFLDALSSNSAPLISICADGIKDNYINSNEERIKNIVVKQINEYLNNSEFIESIFSLTNLSKRIDKAFYLLIKNILDQSSLYSVKKFVAAINGKNFSEKRNDSKFNDFWENSFKYKYAVIESAKGKFKIELAPQYAPITVGSFCYLAKQSFFKDVIFHRVVPGFVIQTGDPTATGWGGPGYEISSEYSNIGFKTGFVGMASAGKDTEGSQWFVMQGYFPHLNGRYTNFGKVISGQSVVDQIDQGDKILSVNLIN